MTIAAPEMTTAPATQTPPAPAAAAPAPSQPAPAAPPVGGTPPPADASKPPQPAGSLLGEAKPVEGGKAEPKPGDAPVSKAPETYADFTLPEGLTLDAKAADGFKALAKEAGLSQEFAQKFVTWDAERTKAGMEALNAAAQQEMVKMVEDLQTQTRKDLGAGYDETLGLAASAMDRFGGAELRKLVKDSVLGNHVVFIKAMAAVGKAIAEHKHVEGSGAPMGDTSEDLLRTQFPSMYNADGTRKPEFRKRT